MFKKAAQQKQEVINGLRGGKGDIHITWLLNTEESFGKLKLSSRMVIPNGSEIGIHPHGPDAEIYYLVSGELECNDNGTIVTMNPGDVMITGGGEIHGCRNVSGKDAELLGFIVL